MCVWECAELVVCSGHDGVLTAEGRLTEFANIQPLKPAVGMVPALVVRGAHKCLNHAPPHFNSVLTIRNSLTLCTLYETA